MKMPFDECWLINLVERPDRKQYMLNQFEKLGILDQVKIHQAVKGPRWIYEIFHEAINEKINVSGDGYRGWIDVPAAINCWREHYTLIKSAYLRGLNSICIIEDDCGFIKNEHLFQEYLDNLPSDWGVLKLNCLRGPMTQEYVNDHKHIYKYWFPQINLLWGTGCYALSRDAMKYIIDYYEIYFTSIDTPICDQNKIVLYNNAYKKFDKISLNERGINMYISELPLGLCKSDYAKESDLHNNLTNHIGKNNIFFLAEKIDGINLDDYF